MVSRSYWFWGDTGLTPTFVFIFDYRSSFLFFLWIVMPHQVWLLKLAVPTLIAFTVLSRFGWSLPVFIRLARRALSDGTCTARPAKLRRLGDFQTGLRAGERT